MAIQFSKKAPSDGFSRIKSHLSQPQNYATSTGARSLMGLPAMHISDPIQIWSVDLGDTHISPLNSVAKEGEWRYHLFERTTVIAEAQLGGVSGSGVSATTHGPTTSGIIDALGIAEKLSETKRHDFEPRILLIPSISFAGLWLHSLDDYTKDLIIPIPPSTLSLAHFKPASFTLLEAEVKSEAGKILASIKAMPGPSGGSGNSISPSDSSNVLPSIIRLSVRRPKTAFSGLFF